MASPINEYRPREPNQPGEHPTTPEKLWEQPQLVAGAGFEPATFGL